VNDRRIDRDGERRRFTSRILPPHIRRSPKVAEVLPVLYLRGQVRTGVFLLEHRERRQLRVAEARLLVDVVDAAREGLLVVGP
jgi:hypothetical protein